VEVVFVTGFPGPRARHRAEAILAEESETHVWLLVAEATLAEAAARIDRWSERRRVRVLGGDPAGLDFGLSGSEYRELAEATTLVSSG
jgi:thioester reductase-like protein